MGIPDPLNPGKQSNTTILAASHVPYADVYKKMETIQSVGDYHSIDGGLNFNQKQYPASVDSKRVHVRYAVKTVVKIETVQLRFVEVLPI